MQLEPAPMSLMTYHVSPRNQGICIGLKRLLDPAHETHDIFIGNILRFSQTIRERNDIFLGIGFTLSMFCLSKTGLFDFTTSYENTNMTSNQASRLLIHNISTSKKSTD